MSLSLRHVTWIKSCPLDRVMSHESNHVTREIDTIINYRVTLTCMSRTCCSVLQCPVACCGMLQCGLQCVAVWVAVSCSVGYSMLQCGLQCVAVWVAVCCSVGYSVLQCPVACCGMLQCGLQCVAVWVTVWKITNYRATLTCMSVTLARMSHTQRHLMGWLRFISSLKS